MNKLQKRALLADLALLGVAVIWGGGFVAAKIALEAVSPFYLLGIRVLGAGLLLALLFHQKLRQVNKKTVKTGIFLGLFLLIGQGMQVFGLQFTTPGKQAFLVASYTLFIPFVAWLIFKRRPQVPSILAGLIMLVGIGFLSLNEDFSIGFGDGLSILSAIFFAVHMVLIALCVQEHDPLQLSVLQLLAAGTMAFILAFIFEKPIIALPTASLISVGYLLLINTALAFSVQNFAQKFTTPTRSSIIVSLESLFGLIFSVLILKETFTSKMIVGVIFIAIAVGISKLEKATR